MKQIKYRGGYLYQLAEDYTVRIPITPRQNIVTEFVYLTTEGDLTLRRGYAWDGPSGPTIDTASAMRGSLIHDSLYQLIRQGPLGWIHRAVADQVYEDTCIEDGMWSIRAWAHFKALRAFGGAAADPSHVKPVLAAP